jgi:uncharacterized membrane protein
MLLCAQRPPPLTNGNETQPARTGEAIPRPRIQTLSDLIFGLALSIGAISLLGGRPSNLPDLLGSLLGFGWAFVILALVWVRYTRIMSVLPIETNTMVGMNLLLLFLVSIEPYLYNLISNSFVLPGASIGSGITTSLYAGDMTGIFLVIAYFLFELTKEERNLLPRRLLRGYRLMAYGSIAAAALFLVSIIPVFWSVDILGIQTRFIFWMGTFVVMVIRKGVEGRTKGANPGQPVAESGMVSS